jgi:hypothetical protein
MLHFVTMLHTGGHAVIPYCGCTFDRQQRRQLRLEGRQLLLHLLNFVRELLAVLLGRFRALAEILGEFFHVAAPAHATAQAHSVAEGRNLLQRRQRYFGASTRDSTIKEREMGQLKQETGGGAAFLAYAPMN